MDQTTGLTKAIAVALDIAGRPETSDEYALSSVRKAYRLLNGGTFQDLVGGHESTAQPTNDWMDWSEAYRLELEKNEMLTRQLDALRSELAQRNIGPSPGRAQPRGEQPSSVDVGGERSNRIERTRATIVAALCASDQTVHDLSRRTNIHLRTLQRRLAELIADGLVRQNFSGVTPIYAVVDRASTSHK